jgi:hypothetical protein
MGYESGLLRWIRMSKKPPKFYKQTQTCCGKKLVWENCGHRAGVACGDCAGAGGWWLECPKCGYQPYKKEELC